MGDRYASLTAIAAAIDYYVCSFINVFFGLIVFFGLGYKYSSTLNQQHDAILWSHVTKVKKPNSKERGGNTKIKCNFCNNEFVGSLSRTQAHLLKIKRQGVAICTKITVEVPRQIKKELEEAEERSKSVDIPLPPSGQNQ
ncbi:hypothetical protein OROMI_011592 [Orobanche minor]